MSGSFDTLSLLSLRELEFTREQAVAASQRLALFFFSSVSNDRFPKFYRIYRYGYHGNVRIQVW